MNTDGYVREKLSSGVSCLVGAGDIRSRLLSAFISMTTISSAQFSDELLGARFDDLYSRVTTKQAQGDEGKIHATLSGMTDDEASEIAHELFEIFSEALRG